MVAKDVCDLIETVERVSTEAPKRSCLRFAFITSPYLLL